LSIRTAKLPNEGPPARLFVKLTVTLLPGNRFPCASVSVTLTIDVELSLAGRVVGLAVMEEPLGPLVRSTAPTVTATVVVADAVTPSTLNERFAVAGAVVPVSVATYDPGTVGCGVVAVRLPEEVEINTLRPTAGLLLASFRTTVIWDVVPATMLAALAEIVAVERLAAKATVAVSDGSFGLPTAGLAVVGPKSVAAPAGIDMDTVFVAPLGAMVIL
jgi:hypothetical protein